MNLNKKENLGCMKKSCLYIEEIRIENDQEYDFSLALKIPDWIQIIWGRIDEEFQSNVKS